MPFSPYKNRKRVQLILEGSVHKAALTRVEEFQFVGGFSEYVARLILADAASKGYGVMRVSSVEIRRMAR